MILPKGFKHTKGLNKDADRIQHVVFTTLEEYGLPVEPGSTDNDLSIPEDFYKDGYFGVLRNEEDEIIASFGLLEYKPGIVEIRKMYLLKEYRRRGLGKYMMEFLLSKAMEMGYHTVMLETASELVEAIMMYEKYGFVLDTESPHTDRCDRVYYKSLK